MYHSDCHGWCVYSEINIYIYIVDICAYIWSISDSLKWWDLFSRRSYELLALILINSAHSDRHWHAMQVIQGRYDASVISRSILHPESPWDLVLWSRGATGLHIHIQLWLWPCYFPNTLVSVDVCWYRSMKQAMFDNLFFGHFASFMIILFDCTGKILDVSPWLPWLMCIFIYCWHMCMYLMYFR